MEVYTGVLLFMQKKSHVYLEQGMEDVVMNRLSLVPDMFRDPKP